MRLFALIALLLCIVVVVGATEPHIYKRKGGGGGGHGGGGGGGHGSSGGSGGKPSGGGGSSSKPGGSSSSSSSKPPSTNSGMKGGGGSSGKGSGSYGDRPPSYASLFPSRSGYNAGGRGVGAGDASHPYGPPPAYSASANYASVSRGQTVPAYSFKSNPPTTYYASPYRSTYPGAWGYGYYPIYPYPWWAYGAGAFVGASYVASPYHHGIYTYKSEFRNVTVANATNVPTFDNMDLFRTGNNITYVDFNNGTVKVGPCGNSTSAKLNVSASDCAPVYLDVKGGRVVSGNARSFVDDEITFFNVTLGSNTATLRTMAISSTKKSARGGIVAGIVVGCVAFVVLVGVAIWLIVRWRKRNS
ncbi:hypothetical protein IW140_003582 [Coemansia sp. RSA 1813]|nr:hypothetical protein EV178_003449 [Coemansia sp. RSA 1646]KAJ1769319.1 hypothetical protein LPJ74_004146 [Coemansia sp. RSA 1843]KAJ2215633.1 hypothetical protein EV179_002044 [Coemansia sp. RSA 487]KAJ2568825.1 hypothetical protein IW140_003582 [Coemansia sp. RSA 1813]